MRFNTLFSMLFMRFFNAQMRSFQSRHHRLYGAIEMSVSEIYFTTSLPAIERRV